MSIAVCLPEMYLRLDPWAAEYNTAYYAEEVSAEAAQNVEPAIELEQWRPITPRATELPYEALLFIDGSRRIEARVLLETAQEQAAFGAIGSYGIGVVNCCPTGSRQAEFMQIDVQRLCTLSNGQTLEHFDVTSELKTKLGKLAYQVVSSEERDADAVLRELQFEMLRAERKLASRLFDENPEALIICDGPRPRMGDANRVVGYVKTIHDVRIGQAQLEVVRKLEQGQRSPLFLVTGEDKSQSYFEWFLRLRDPRPWLYSLAGMVRLQAYAGTNPDARLPEVQALADGLTQRLPTFASRQHQDPRAPQQLLPIRALESELRRYMGHPQIIRRRITQYLSTQQLGTQPSAISAQQSAND